MSKYRGKKSHREAHPKIYVWTHAEKAEIDHFKDFRDYFKIHLLMPNKEICWAPWELINKVIEWRKKQLDENKISEEDNDQVWCIFDVDDFYKQDSQNFLQSIKKAHKNKIKIAYMNECFELWALLHLEKIHSRISRGKEIAKKIAQAFEKNDLPFKKDRLGNFEKNQPIFEKLLPFQPKAIKHAKILIPEKYEKINWSHRLSKGGNPSTSIHFLIEEINLLIKKNKNFNPRKRNNAKI